MALAGFIACDKEQVSNPVNVEKVTLTFSAGQEGVGTRAAIDAADSKVINWTAGDKLSVFDGTSNNQFDLTSGAGTAIASFSGTVASSATALAVLHPYQAAASYDGTKISGVVLKSEQTAVAGSFDPAAALMATTGDASSKSVSLKNAVGYIKVTPQFACKKISLESKSSDDALSGTGEITFDASGNPTLSATSGSSKVSISGSLEAGKTYYIAVLPVELKSGFKLIFKMSDDSERYRESGSNVLTVAKNKVVNLGSVKATDIIKNLANGETANCYLIKNSGKYRFPTVKGNSSTSVGEVASAAVLWESFGTTTAPQVGDLISSVSYSDGYITFSTPDTFAQGNAVIAAKDAEGTILWSWHIWCASEGWNEQTYRKDSAGSTGKKGNNLGYSIYKNMMDRNLGAISTSGVGAFGLLYQWGRKDPFLGAASVSSASEVASSTGTWPAFIFNNKITQEVAAKNPMAMYGSFYMDQSTVDRPDNYLEDGSWSGSKTIYDPCPAGWRVPDGGSGGFWATAINGTTGKNGNCYGFKSYLAMGFLYPIAGYKENGTLADANAHGYYWSVNVPAVDGSSDTSDAAKAYLFKFGTDGSYETAAIAPRAYGMSVRCSR